MKIILEGNKKSFQFERDTEKIIVVLSEYNDQPITVKYKDEEIYFKNKNQFYSYSSRIKGADKISIIEASNELNFSEIFTSKLFDSNEIEIGIFKSIFLIYNWIEIALTDAYAVDLSSKIYNEFIIDYSTNLEVQKDMYFISSKYLKNNYDIYINKLIDLNLLVSANFQTEVGNNKSYFIPLVKPGVSKEHFVTDFDSDGNKTYKLWKEILSERDTKIKTFFSNRMSHYG